MRAIFSVTALVRVCLFSIVAISITSTQASAQYVINNTTETVPGTHATPWEVPGTGELIVGQTGTGQLDIVSGGIVVSAPSIIAQSATSSGTVSVAGSEATWETGALTVGNAGAGTLTVANTGTVTSTSAVIGLLASSVSSASISGGGSTWSADTLTVGGAGTGTLTAEDGGTVLSDTLTVGDTGTGHLDIVDAGIVVSTTSIVANAAGSQGTASVSGVESTWDAGALTIGNAGHGTLTVSSSGSVDSTSAVIGAVAGSVGSASVSGSGSTWDAGTLTVGDAGTGSLDVEAGGQVTSTSATIGAAANGQGTATVTGNGSTWNAGTLTVGGAGSGQVDVKAGGNLTTTDATLGDTADGEGTINVTGYGSTWNGDEITVGGSGTGHVSITAGGTATTQGVTVGSDAGSEGTVTVSGTGSTWTNNGMTIGSAGEGTMSISGGGIVNSGSSSVGSSDGSTGTVTISGANSAWNVNGLTVGDDGTGTVNVTNGATLNLGTYSMYIGGSEGNGTVNVSGASTVTSGDVTLGYYGSAPEGTMNVSGSGTEWNINGSLTVGYEGGAGTVNITGGAHVSTTSYLTMGYYEEGITRGDMTISGAGSQLVVGSGTYIGYYAGADVVVSNGGLLQSDSDAYIASYYTQPSSVTVTGAGSQWTIAGYLYDGYYGEGTINVANGGYVSVASDAYFGYYDYGTEGGIANISGAGSKMLLSGDAYIGYEGKSTVTVSNGGVLQTDGAAYLGDGNAGKVTVTGTGSKWIADTIEVGAYYGGSYPDSRGDVIVSNGGAVTASTLALGTYEGAPGTVLVTGQGSHIDLTGALTIGDLGEGTATLANGGKITAASVTLGDEGTATGTLIFGAAVGDAPVASGVLDTPTVTFGDSSETSEIVFNYTGKLDFDPELLGTGNISVLAGTTTFSTDSVEYSGDVTVSGGKAVFNADYGGAAVVVSDNGIVGGSGTISSLDAQAGGTVAPGNSPGTLHVVGDVSFAAGTTYAVEVKGAQHDLIDAGGTATLNGGTVFVSGTPALMTYTILTATTGVTGAFDELKSASAFYAYHLDYDLNNVYLVVDGITSFTIAARTPNELAVARALDRFPSDNPLYNAVAALDLASARQAFNALSGEIHASVGTALADNSRYVREAITGRLIQAFYGGGGDGQPIVMAAAAPQDVATVDTSTRMSLGSGYGAASAAPAGGHNLAYWSRAFGAWGQYDSNGNAATTDRNLGGFITGVDGGLGGGWRAGLATGYMYTALDDDARLSSARINSYVLGGYAGGAIGDFALRSGGTWTWSNVDTSRNVVFPGFNEFEGASYGGDTGQLFAELAYPIFAHGGIVEPFAGLAYVHVGTDGFTESGAVAGLTTGGNDMNLGYGTLGARTGTTLVWGGTTVIPHASLAWQYAFGDTTPEQALAFASTGIGIGIGGVPLATNSALIEIGADAVIAQDATLGISYIGQYSGNFDDSGLRGRFDWRF